MIIIISVLLLLIIFLLLFVIITFFLFAIDLFLDLPYVATKKEKIGTIIRLANIKKGETVVDLGSGDGRLLFAAAKSGVHAVGYEINPFLIVFTKVKAYFLFPSCHCGERSDSRIDSGQARMTGSVIVKRQNLWKANLKIADVIFVYGRKKTMQKFEDFVFQNAKRGARIVVNTNAFPKKKPLKSENEIFLYRIS